MPHKLQGPRAWRPNRLTAARILKGWNQERLAIAIGTQPSAISHWERGRRTPNIDNLCKLSDVLGVDLDVLCPRRNEP